MFDAIPVCVQELVFLPEQTHQTVATSNSKFHFRQRANQSGLNPVQAAKEAQDQLMVHPWAKLMCSQECFECIACADKSFHCPACTSKMKGHSCALGKPFQSMPEALKEAYFQIVAHEGKGAGVKWYENIKAEELAKARARVHPRR
jgi:hypothetical protein